MLGLRKYLSPFAPDQSGATAVLYALGGILVICDAGGCAGNVCGFDEPRWFGTKSAVFSAGLRDMDAILGRDDRLVKKLADAANSIDARFAAIIGTPVPAVIGTDYAALGRMAEKETGLPVLTVDTAGFALYDTGIEKATLAVLQKFAKTAFPVEKDRIGVLGMTPLDFPTDAVPLMEDVLRQQGYQTVCCYGMNGNLDDIIHASAAAVNLVVSPGGLAGARYLRRIFGTPYRCADPLSAVPDQLSGQLDAKRILIIDQQVRADTLRRQLSAAGAQVRVGSWFLQPDEVTQPGDLHFTQEDQLQDLLAGENFDILIGDRAFFAMASDPRPLCIDLPHFAVSGGR